MGIVIVAGAAGAVVVAVLVATAVRMIHRPVPAAWGSPPAGQSGPYVGAACRCGHGQLGFKWWHGYGQILGCSNYPICRLAYQFNGLPLPEAQLRALLQVR
jgi:hypothetical protein